MKQKTTAVTTVMAVGITMVEIMVATQQHHHGFQRRHHQ
jgi:hypothetical protein